MSSVDTHISNAPVDARRFSSQKAILLLFTATLFVSALLLFSVQPLFTKMVLPRLGGSPSVWSVAMVFFQGVLLAGYGYAHALTRFARPKVALAIHAVVLLVAFIALPIAVSGTWGDPPQSGQALWLIGLFAASVGLPFFAVSANGPLLQAWFSRTNHPHADDPYFLYGASNVGSFAALISYPVLLEPVFSLGTQAWLWSAGFALLVVLIIASGLVSAKGKTNTTVQNSTSTLPDNVPTIGQRARWVGLAFVPSGLLVAVTQYISTDIAAAPFLWVIPLALFLLTFVITFQRNPFIKHDWVSFLLPLLVAPIAISLFMSINGLYAVITTALLHFLVFFVAAMVCHGELVRRRPSAGHLTEFYLWMSFGGVLGGIFTSLIAPSVFSTVLEYPILIALVLLCRSEFYRALKGNWTREVLVVAVAAGLLLLPKQIGFAFSPDTEIFFYLGLVIFAALIMLSREMPVRHFSLVASVLVLGGVYQSGLSAVEYDRSFFGINKMAETRDGQYRLLFQGTTLHGAERIRNEDGSRYSGKPVPTTYYYDGGPLSQTIAAVRATRGGSLKVASVGLGSGSLACYAQPGDSWKFFEIDPAVVKIARDPSKFRFLSECGKDMPIVVGDARLTMSKETDGTYDLIILDAFSSDAIPLHLLTSEAMGLYLSKLSPNGAIVFHISNRHMRLAEVVSSVAATKNLVTYSLLKYADKSVNQFDETSMVAIVARKKDDLGVIAKDGVWREVVVDGSVKPWTDDYSNIMAAIYRHYSGSYE